MRLFYYSVPVTTPIQEFIINTEAVRGSLTGGFQTFGDNLLSRVQDERLYLDDACMGRAYRYARTYVPGGWQDTHLPPFIDEIERLLGTRKPKLYRPYDRQPEKTE